MHFAKGAVPEDYLVYVRRKYFWIMGGLLLLFIMLVCSISVGAVEIPPYKVMQTLSGQEPVTQWDKNIWNIIWNIRLPQALAAIVAGAGLSRLQGLRCSLSCAIPLHLLSRLEFQTPALSELQCLLWFSALEKYSPQLQMP